MPHDWEPSKRRYRSPSGKLVSRREVRALIDKLTTFVRKDAARIARRFDAGKITAAEFNGQMRELLKAGHIVASTVGRGGRDRMTAKDWGEVGRKIKWQYGYLDKFTRKLSAGTLKTANTVSRAKLYADSIYISYAKTFQVTQTEFIEGGGNINPEGEMLCYLEQNSEEGCAECTADAGEGPMPVSEMKELGERECGDWCKCEIIFDDEPEYKP